MHIRVKPNALYLYFFALLNALCLVSCFVNIRLGIVSSVLIFFVFIFYSGKKGFLYEPVFFIYLIAQLISVIAYLWNGRPFVIFIQAISFNFVPSLLFFLGRYIAKSNNEEKWQYYTLNAFCFMMLVGTITYILTPGFYYKYLGQSVESYAYGLEDYRYGSYISSIALGSVSSICILLYFSVFDRLSRWQRIAYLPLILLNVAMCMQRSAWIVAVIALFASLFYKFGKDRKMRIRIFLLLVGVVFLIIVVLIYRNVFFTSTQLLYFESRIGVVTLENMFSSRNSQWQAAFEIFKENPLFGFGLGSCGQKAAPFDMDVVTDGNHLRILVEIGIFGFIAFSFLNVRGVVRSLKRKQFYVAMALILYNLAAVGSPIFDQYYASFAYWIILGCASTNITCNNLELE